MRAHCRALVARRGLSILELMGCLCAVAGGVVLGSMYLGVDVQQAAVRLLQRTETAQVAAEPTAVAGAATPTPVSATPSPALLAPNPSPVAEPSPAPAPSPAAAALAALPLPTLAESIAPEQREALTRDYWHALNGCIEAETHARRAAIDASGEWELYDYLSRRGSGHQAAADCIARLNLRGVDDHVASYAERVQDWHEEGATLFARAKDLLTDAPTAQLSGPFAQSWQSAATQHQMEERLLKEKHQAVQAYLEHADRDAAAPQE